MASNTKVQDHVLVPLHTLLTKEEAQALCSHYNVTLTQMPSISSKDPAIKDLNAEAGDVIKIIRKSPTERDPVFYRVVKAAD